MLEKQSKYCYPDSDVLINKFNIEDGEFLNDIERVITTYRISQLECHDISLGTCFSYKNYFKIHEWIFQDVYSFAGKIRNEVIYKSNLPYRNNVTLFCDPKYVVSNVQDILQKLLMKVKKVQSREEFLDVISWFYGEMNIVHPFREGNGRTLRTFLELFVAEANSYLDMPDMEIHYSLWNNDDKKGLMRATIVSSLTADSSELVKCFDKVLVKKEVKKKSK